MSTTPSDPAYWQEIYDAGDARWDLGAAAPAWEALSALHGIVPGRALVLGAGRGHDALWFASRGHEVTAIDFAESAVKATRAAAAAASLRVDARRQNLFDLTPDSLGLFDIIVEHTCFCAIEPHRRSEYEAVVSRLLRPGGSLLAVFFWNLPSGGPPFGTSEAEVSALFNPDFEALRLEANPTSVPSRQGREGWAVLRRLDRT
jgi:SAM-dependent methyltransferase